MSMPFDPEPNVKVKVTKSKVCEMADFKIYLLRRHAVKRLMGESWYSKTVCNFFRILF